VSKVGAPTELLAIRGTEARRRENLGKPPFGIARFLALFSRENFRRFLAEKLVKKRRRFPPSGAASASALFGAKFHEKFGGFPAKIWRLS